MPKNEESFDVDGEPDDEADDEEMARTPPSSASFLLSPAIWSFRYAPRDVHADAHRANSATVTAATDVSGRRTR